MRPKSPLRVAARAHFFFRHRRALPGAASAVALALAAPATAFAQTAKNATELPAVTVETSVPKAKPASEAGYVDSANTFETDADAIWGAKVGLDNGGPITAYLEGRNLSDETYIASSSVAAALAGTGAALLEPGTGRAIYGGVQVRW